MIGLITTTGTMTSIQIAELIDKRHADIMRDIRDEVEKLDAGGIDSQSKFALAEYDDAQDKKRPCYTLTREGILQLAARYDAVTRAKLIEMAFRSEQPKPMSQLEIMHQMTGAMLEQDRQLKAISGTVDAIQTNMQDMREVIALDPTGWREDCARLVAKIAKKAGGVEHIKDVWSEVHRLVDTRMSAHLNIRITNIQKRLALEGASKTKIKSINALDAISENKRLIEGTCHIVKMLAVKNGVGVS